MNNMKLGRNALDKRVSADFRGACARAFRNDILALLRGRDNTLLSFDAVRRGLGDHQEAYLGVHPVEVTSVLGSLNRTEDFERSFMPRGNHLAERWKRVDRAHYEGIELPPPVLLQVGGVFFVYDGHNRLSVARLHGMERIQADVVAYQTHTSVLLPAQTARPLAYRYPGAELGGAQT